MQQQKSDPSGLTFEPSAFGNLSPSDVKKTATFLFEFTQALSSAATEAELIERARAIIISVFDPKFVFLAIPKFEEPNVYDLHFHSKASEEEVKSLADSIKGLLLSGIDSIFEQLFDTFPSLKDVSKIIIRSPASSRERILILLFGVSRLNDEQSTAISSALEQLIRLRLESLRLRGAVDRRMMNLAWLHQSAAGLSGQLLNVNDLLRAISEEGRRVLGASAAAVLMPASDPKDGYVSQASSGFDSEQLPLSPAMFNKALEEFHVSHRKAITFKGQLHEFFLLVPLIFRGQSNGMILFYSNIPDFQLTDDLIQIAEIFGGWVSIAIENATMFERVSSSQREWENTFDSIADPIYIVDTEYKLRKMNKSLAAFTMKSIKLPLEMSCFRYLFQRSTICPWCPVPKGMQTGQAITVEAPVFADGIWQIQSFPYTDKSDNRIGSINVLRDITILKRMQDQLIESEKMASTGKLISGVAHEVRNPLFGISTTVRALSNELGNKEELKPFLEIITSETGRLNRLMEDLLNYSRPVKIDKNQSDIVEIVKEVIEHFQHIPAAQDVQINLFTSDNIPPMYVDRNKINQVLVNLFDNGIQHSRGAAKIDVFLEYLSLANPPEIHLVVKDYGIGIGKDYLPRIFDPFYTTRQRGTGLGLSIVRKVIHDHGGRIGVESHQDVGTTFRISLPVTPR
jgi:two-component system NtrC family sensor kinase